MQAQALAVTVAWLRLERAHARYAEALRRGFGVTPLQIAILSVLAERPTLPLAALRLGLAMHAATLGQAVEDLRTKGLCTVRTDPKDRRARLVAMTEAGRALFEAAPKAGPVLLRSARADPRRLEALAEGLGEALELFGLEDWAPGGEAR